MSHLSLEPGVADAKPAFILTSKSPWPASVHLALPEAGWLTGFWCQLSGISLLFRRRPIVGNLFVLLCVLLLCDRVLVRFSLEFPLIVW